MVKNVALILFLISQACFVNGQYSYPAQPTAFPEKTLTDKGEFNIVLMDADPRDTSILLPQYEKLEIGVRLPDLLMLRVKQYIYKKGAGSGINPFDSAQIDVWGEFIHIASGRIFRYNGFYFEEFKRILHPTDPNQSKWQEDTTSYPFRIRFANGLNGKWKARIFIKSLDKQIKSAEFKFDITNSDIPGYLRTVEEGNPNDKYLRFDNGQFYLPVGETVAYMSWDDLKPDDHKVLQHYMEEIKDAKGNMVRLWMNIGGFLIEREKLGDYGRNYSPFYKRTINRQVYAWELDRAFNYAEELKLYVMLAVFGSELDRSDPEHPVQSMHWDNNPYRNNLRLKEPWEFYYSDTALLYAKKRMRYVMARWGYNHRFAICEITGEPAKIGADDDKDKKAKLMRWFTEMHNYIDNKPTDKVTIIDFANSNRGHKYRYDYFSETPVDIASVNDYNTDPDVNYTTRWKKANKWRKKDIKYKPFLFAEFGAFTFPNLDYATGVPMHNALWSSAFNGSCGPAFPYWWDRIHAEGAGHQQNFVSLVNYFKGIDLSRGQYTQDKWRDGLNYEGIVNYFVVNERCDTAYGWAHNTAFNWVNMYYFDEEVKFLIDSCSGKRLRYPDGNFVDAYDDQDYCNKKRFKVSKEKPGHLKGKKVKIEDMDARSVYKIEWYSTHEEGGHLSEFDETIKTGWALFGKRDIEVEFPALSYESYGTQDFAFKLYKVE